MLVRGGVGWGGSHLWCPLSMWALFVRLTSAAAVTLWVCGCSDVEEFDTAVVVVL